MEEISGNASVVGRGAFLTIGMGNAANERNCVGSSRNEGRGEISDQPLRNDSGEQVWNSVQSIQKIQESQLHLKSISLTLKYLPQN